MAFNPNELNSKNTPARWKIQGKRLADSGAEGAAELANLDSVYKEALERAATFTSDEEMGVGNQPGVGSEAGPSTILVSNVAITGAKTIDENTGSADHTVDLGVTIEPSNATSSTVVWTSSDTGVATVVSATGVVTAVAAGEVEITVTAADANGAKDTIDITVINTTEVSSVDITGVVTPLSLTGTDSVDLGVTVLPVNAADSSVTWESDDEAVATVDSDGVVQALTTGTANISVTANDGSGETDSEAIVVNA